MPTQDSATNKKAISVKSIPIDKDKLDSSIKNAKSEQTKIDSVDKNTYHKSDIIDVVTATIEASGGKADKNAVSKHFDLICNAIQDALRMGHEIKIPGFLSITPQMMPERKGINPKTRQPIIVKPSIKFNAKISKKIKDKALDSWHNKHKS